MKLTVTLLLALVLSNLIWAVEYRKLWYYMAETEGHLDEAEHYIQTTEPLPSGPQMYRLTPQHNRYEIGVSCAEKADPTVAGNFDGMLMVSCGNMPENTVDCDPVMVNGQEKQECHVE